MTSIVIDESGNARMVYADELREIALGLGPLTITRASHVEPDADSLWWADLSPFGGPRLGPYEHRQTALDHEAAWLEAHLSR